MKDTGISFHTNPWNVWHQKIFPLAKWVNFDGNKLMKQTFPWGRYHMKEITPLIVLTTPKLNSNGS